MPDIVTFLLIACIPALPFAFMLSSALAARRFPGKIRAYTLTAFGLAWLAAVATLAIVTFGEPVNISLLKLDLGTGPITIFGFLADRLSVVILLLVVTVSGIVHLYSLRAMQEERNFRRYFTLLSLVTIEVLLVVLANNLLMLGIFWILKGFTLTFLLAHYNDRPASWKAAFTKLRIDLVGAGSFILALVLTWKIFGTFDLAVINNLAARSPESLPALEVTILTALLFVAAMAKSAQFPLYSWLPASVEAPTPVSALMHAGLINAGGFLLIRLSPLFLATPATMGLVIVVGGFTAIYGTMLMLTRNDVKGMLVYSTMGQMGFMMLECGLGAFGLATLHILAHGLFKATLFLSSGSVIQQKSAEQLIAPAGHGHGAARSFPALRFAFTSVFAGILLFSLPLLLGYPVTSGSILLAFAWITVAYALTEIGRISPVKLIPAIAVLILVYLVAIHATEAFFAPAMAPAPALDPNLVIALCGGLVVAGIAGLLLQNAGRPAWLNRIMRTLYVRALFSGYGR